MRFGPTSFAAAVLAAVASSLAGCEGELGEDAASTADALSAAEARACGGTLTTTGALRVRRGPGTSYAVVETLAAGAHVELAAASSAARDPNWVPIEPFSEAAPRWVHAGYLRCDGGDGTGVTDGDECGRLVSRWRAERRTPAGVRECIDDPTRCGLAKNSQYEPEITSRYGFYACGLVASSSMAPRTKRLDEIARIRANAGDAYGNTTGIQPHALAAALAPLHPSGAVEEHDQSSLVALHDAVVRGDLVVVDHLATEGGGRATVTTQGRTFAHFARVLAMDPAAGKIYLENSLTPAGENAFAVDAATFCKAWEHPETGASSRPDVALDPVTRWFVSVDADAVEERSRVR